MVRIVGGECTGSCRLGHVFLTFPSFPPSPVRPPLSAARFFFFFLSFFLPLLSLSGEERSDEEDEIGRRGSERKRPRGTTSNGGRVGEKRGGRRERERGTLPLPLSSSPCPSLLPSAARDSGREEHYNSPSLLPSLPPTLFVLVANLSPSPPPPRLLHFCTPATFPSLVALLPRPSPRDTVLALLQRPSAPLCDVCTLSCTQHDDDQRCRDTRLSASRE